MRLRISIGAKQVVLLTLVIVATVVGVTYLSTRLFIKDNLAVVQQTNLDAANHLGNRVREQMLALGEKARTLGLLLKRITPEKDQVFVDLFKTQPEILAVMLVEAGEGGPNARAIAVAPSVKKSGDETGQKTFQLVFSPQNMSVTDLLKGESQFTPVRLNDTVTAVAVGFPFEKGKKDFLTGVVLLLTEPPFLKAFTESDSVTTFLVDKKGHLFAHSDISLLETVDAVSEYSIVREAINGKLSPQSMRYTDPRTRERKMGAHRLVGFAGMAVVAEVQEAKATLSAKRAELRSALVGAAGLSLGIFLFYLLALTLRGRLRALHNAAEQMARGDLKIAFKRRSSDEIGEVTLAFVEMARSLDEQARRKSLLAKFQSTEIAEKMVNGDAKVDGEKRPAVFLVCDLRGFAKLAESMTPEEIVSTLNEYDAVMSGVIRKYGGVVDKFVGDAITAFWGLPFPGDNDAYNAVSACLAMRTELAALNKTRLERVQPVLHIGMGLSQGEVVAGNFGTGERAEYTVFGGPVDIAAIVELETKRLGTDLLVTDAIQEALKTQFLFESCESIPLKASQNRIQIFRVTGYRNAEGEAVLIQTPYSAYEPDEPAEASEASPGEPKANPDEPIAA